MRDWETPDDAGRTPYNSYLLSELGFRFLVGFALVGYPGTNSCGSPAVRDDDEGRRSDSQT